MHKHNMTSQIVWMSFDCAKTPELLCLSGYLWGWERWYVLSLLFLASVRPFVLFLKYERCHMNKI